MSPHTSALAALLSIPDWYDSALCAQTDLGLFYGETGQSHFTVAAKAVCKACPVKSECLDYALTTPPERDWGVWGGTTKMERINLRRERGVA